MGDAHFSNQLFLWQVTDLMDTSKTLMESFFKTLKTELIYHEIYRTREQAKQIIFEFIDVFYNRERYQHAKKFSDSLLRTGNESLFHCTR
ncbi:MAG: IS3 family transposase [Magnetococcales bacterium]|nr:IS3 family transposase [Magnetococcales bacterium]